METVGRWALAGGAGLAPLALMPDLAAGLGGRLQPVDFPDEYAAAREVLADAAEGREGSLLVLPFTSYRLPDWNEGRRTLDPLGRYLTPNYLASDDLFVSGEPVSGEDERGRRVAASLDAGLTEGALATALAAEGIHWVVLDREALEALGETATMPAGEVLHDGERLTLRELEGPVSAAPGKLSLGLAGLAWGVWGAALGATAGVAARRSLRRSHRSGDPRGESDTAP